MTSGGQSQVFGKRKENVFLILACGEKVRHMTVRPWMTAAGVSIFGLFTIIYLTATAYLVIRDDLIGASMARQARMQHEYEDRISALRAQVDRITSRQLLDQQVVEDKVEKLLEQQMALTNRQGMLGSVLERAENSGLEAASPVSVEASDSLTQDHSDAGSLDAFKTLLGEQHAELGGMKTRALAFAAPERGMADRADKLFSKVTHSLKSIEMEQLTHIQNLTVDASERTENIRRILTNTGVNIPEKMAGLDMAEPSDTAMGGPYVAPETSSEFEASIADLDMALDKFEHVKKFALMLPFANPAPGKQITSLFGNRLDPFFGRLAMHAGVDFRQKTGSEVAATGAGVVIAAGPAGGYGIMVEIDHGNGITTRYGHLSRILVKNGDKVIAGETIALSGSTGRSTGPHLHYEVRRNGRAIDPVRFLNAGLKLDTYIE
ncbi:M23 family metallopeptidase [Rhizobium sp. KVB221]|uniref:M23 family metallopeptidase n=1 Tax=Rhizobium setariae TaxID=2801340 RepID=A0A936YVM9_9HYPH|nr:M23 family metallopeptidase [Rhizobium setariae]MBL0373830.1 M23 family metallopeptidase [Rhizobium setariae]